MDSICYKILERVSAARFVRNHIEQLVVPYINEHKLDKNATLYSFIEVLFDWELINVNASPIWQKLADAYYRGSQNSHNIGWEQLGLQIAENISDIDLRCKSIIKIASGSIPPWSTPLVGAVNNMLEVEKDRVDPNL